ncbi:cupredoxin family copper-binding protein [Beijerinckia sp. L45]|uniref:cupredoxin domain-containing protein n=1 Tax=Beijerinckia sp. L45 TaxID=1641855 RepID=UPI00131E09FD|nr:cupredoxin family copper-binding protein [Beijerinckia sp. L45]
MRIILRHAAIGAVLLLAVDAAAADRPANEVTVTIDNFAFTPATITVDAGTHVTWTNRDDIPHTIVDAAEPRAFKSPPLDTGESFDHTFGSAGTFRYFCSLHPHMLGTIIVR